jgi:GNAT superfamily N-acetyltransferase
MISRRFLIEADLTRLAELAPPSEVDIRPFNGPDWSLLGSMMPGRRAGEFDEAAAAGRTCLVAWKRRRAVGYAWFSTTIESRHERYDLPLPSDAVYIHQLRVVRSERRQGVASALLSAGLSLGRERGLCRSWIILDPRNVASVRTIARVAPSLILGVVSRLRLPGWIHCRYRPLHAPFPIQIHAA